MKANALVRLIAPAVFFFSVAPARGDVLISEMCDPRDNYLTDRFIEIYNSGASAVSLSGWSLVAVGNNTNIFTWTLSGSIQPGEALVAGDATTVISFPVDFPQEAWSTSNTFWNGGNGIDGARLMNGATVVDNAVVPSAVFENKDYVRNSNITSANTVYTASEWTATPVDLPTQASPGTHNGTPPPPVPVVSNLQISPASPLPSDSVHVTADVVETVAVLTSVTLSWGTSGGSQPNVLAMALLSGDTYRTVTPIPPQSGGTTVYYKVTATNNASGVGTSTLQSYGIPTVQTIYQVQGQAASSPFAGQTVITSGVVTASYDTAYVIQGGSGAWNGLWVQSSTQPGQGDSLVVRGQVSEATGNTVLTGIQVLGTTPGAAVPAAVALSTFQAGAEAYEGVLVSVANAACTDPDAGAGEWAVNDGSGVLRIDDLGYAYVPDLGTTYAVTGPVSYAGGFKLEPRSAADVVWMGDTAAPVIFVIVAENPTAVRVVFSETVQETSAEVLGHYTIPGLTVSAAVRDPAHPAQVVLSVSAGGSATYTLTVTAVEDLYGNAIVSAQDDFVFFANDIPPGYYDPAAGLHGQPLRAALHGIIDNHTVRSYDYAWTSFRTTDDKPNGNVWDIYSDVPGGTPPYEYTFVTDQCGSNNGPEGTCYNREHSWPNSWFGAASPMYSDLFMLYPTDYEVNNKRGNYPYGEVASASWTSENGCKLGACTVPGYSGTVFEPIDAYKGDLARTYFYVSTRYYTEAGSWPGSPMTSGADVLPWALDMLLQWHAQDPVSLKEYERNSTVYGIQHNRNPYIDHPEYAALVFADPTAVPEIGPPATAVLYPSTPNPFHATTSIRFEVPAPGDAVLTVYDVRGRQVAVVASGHVEPGPHTVVWDGRDADGREVGAGIYFGVLRAGDFLASHRLVLLR